MNNPDIPEIDVHALKKLREENPDLTLIDVREQEEWDQIHIPGALHIPKDRIADKIASVSADKQSALYLHCRSGMRSLHAAQRLKELGYENVYSVRGGILEWTMFGYEVREQ